MSPLNQLYPFMLHCLGPQTCQFRRLGYTRKIAAVSARGSLFILSLKATFQLISAHWF